jgi:hypothetical protein
MEMKKGRELWHDNIDFYLVSLGLAQNEIGVADTQMHCSPERGLVDHIDLGKRDDAKIEKTLPHGAAGVVSSDADATAGSHVAEQPALFTALGLTALRAMMGTLLFRPPELHRKSFLSVMAVLP